MPIYLSPYYGEGQHSAADFMICLNHPHTWDTRNYTKSIEFSLIQRDWTIGSRVNFFLQYKVIKFVDYG